MSKIDFNQAKKTEKTKVSYSISKDIIDSFNKVANKKYYNKSLIVEELLKIFIEKETEKK